MQSHHTALVQSTWEQVLPIADVAAEMFYTRLFEIDPALKPMFAHSDMAEQKKKLMQMITVAVRGLGRIDDLLPAIQALGRRHADYGVRDADYDTVGAALLWTLREGLGDAFTPEVCRAWASTYTTLANVMRSAATEKAA